MQTFCKLACFAFSACYHLLLIPLVGCTSHEDHNQFIGHKSMIKGNFHKVIFYLLRKYFHFQHFSSSSSSICFISYIVEDDKYLSYGGFFNLQLSPQMTSNVRVHGLLLWVSMGLLMPAGILSIRMSVKEERGSIRARVFFYLHLTFQARSSLYSQFFFFKLSMDHYHLNCIIN